MCESRPRDGSGLSSGSDRLRVAECLAGEALSGRLSLEGYQRTPTRLPEGLSFPVETFRQIRRNLRAYREVMGWLADPAAAKDTLAGSFPPA